MTKLKCNCFPSRSIKLNKCAYRNKALPMICIYGTKFKFKNILEVIAIEILLFSKILHVIT